MPAISSNCSVDSDGKLRFFSVKMYMNEIFLQVIFVCYLASLLIFNQERNLRSPGWTQALPALPEWTSNRSGFFYETAEQQLRWLYFKSLDRLLQIGSALRNRSAVFQCAIGFAAAVTGQFHHTGCHIQLNGIAKL